MEPRVVVIASRNPDKVREIRQLCEGLPFNVRSAGDYQGLPDVIEDGTTILGNATRKALVTAAWTGEIAVADDTALRVNALDGLPDIFAARFAGPQATYSDNTRLLLDLMRDVSPEQRGAVFETAVCWVDPRPGDLQPLDDGHTTSRWLLNPWQRDVHIKNPADEAGFWAGLSDHKSVWADFIAHGLSPAVAPGVDLERVIGIFEGLVRPVQAAAADSSVAEGEIRLPDTRIWTLDGPQDGFEPTHIAPSGLDPSAPGRAVNQRVMLELSARGKVVGEISESCLGTRGFGYDPVFMPRETGRTLAQMGSREKNAISHRGRALRRLFDTAGKVYRGGA
jgi:non-canonical purine NTP pyrophosphatase (RdgB/HAM1 family)